VPQAAARPQAAKAAISLKHVPSAGGGLDRERRSNNKTEARHVSRSLAQSEPFPRRPCAGRPRSPQDSAATARRMPPPARRGFGGEGRLRAGADGVRRGRRPRASGARLAQGANTEHRGANARNATVTRQVAPTLQTPRPLSYHRPIRRHGSHAALAALS
jgi:hypothetical protein